MNGTNQHPVIYFDGQCNLCNGFVAYVIKRDPEAKFRFATLQSAETNVNTTPVKNDAGSFETMLLKKDGEVYKYSDAVLNTFAGLKGPAKMLAVLKIIPRSVRDSVYRWIAGKRYWIFGKTEQCMIPTPEIMDRFLTESSE